MGNGAKIWRSKEAREQRHGGGGAEKQGEDGKGLRIPAESGAKKKAPQWSEAKAPAGAVPEVRSDATTWRHRLKRSGSRIPPPGDTGKAGGGLKITRGRA